LPVADAGGMRNMSEPVLAPELRAELEHLGRKSSGRSSFRLLWDRAGLSGGSILSAAAVLSSFKPEEIDWKLMEDLGGKHVYNKKVAMAIALASHGYTYYPWDELHVLENGQGAATALPVNTAFRVGNMSMIDKELLAEDKDFVQVPNVSLAEVRCVGCMWSSEANCFGGSASPAIRCPFAPALGPRYVNAPIVSLHRDDLVTHVGNSHMAVLSTAIPELAARENGTLFKSWVAEILSNTARHAGLHDHTFVLRTALLQEKSEGLSGLQSAVDLQRSAEEQQSRLRRQVGWEALAMLRDYLDTGNYSHMLVLDTDATFVHEEKDTVQEMAKMMDDKGASLLLANQDWDGKDSTNQHVGGMIMARNTNYAKALLKQLLAAHADPKAIGWDVCSTTEKACLQAFLQDQTDAKMHFEMDGTENKRRDQHVVVLSGARYNRHPHHPCRLSKDNPNCKGKEVDIVHFTSEARSDATQYGVVQSWREKNGL